MTTEPRTVSVDLTLDEYARLCGLIGIGYRQKHDQEGDDGIASVRDAVFRFATAWPSSTESN
jgi:hypothetical protein